MTSWLIASAVASRTHWGGFQSKAVCQFTQRGEKNDVGSTLVARRKWVIENQFKSLTHKTLTKVDCIGRHVCRATIRKAGEGMWATWQLFSDLYSTSNNADANRGSFPRKRCYTHVKILHTSNLSAPPAASLLLVTKPPSVLFKTFALSLWAPLADPGPAGWEVPLGWAVGVVVDILRRLVTIDGRLWTGTSLLNSMYYLDRWEYVNSDWRTGGHRLSVWRDTKYLS